MILLQEKPKEDIQKVRKELNKKRHEVHVMMTAYCTINCDENNTSEKDIQCGKDGE